MKQMPGLSAVAVLISVVALAAVAVIHDVQDSRCTAIRACGGCVNCERDVRGESPSAPTNWPFLSHRLWHFDCFWPLRGLVSVLFGLSFCLLSQHFGCAHHMIWKCHIGCQIKTLRLR
jgi:hypothetical protein